MEFRIQRDIFLAGMQKTLGIVEKKTTMPILNNVLVRTEKDKIKIVATDLEIGLTADYEAEIGVQGGVTVSARKLYEMIREIQGEVIQFESNESHRVTVTCDKVIYKISGLPMEDFPSVADDHSDVDFYTVNGRLLRGLIGKTSFAISGDDMRKNLNGVLLETDSDGSHNRLRMVATDGHRLAVANTGVEKASDFRLEKGIIIPKKGLNEVRRLIEDAPEEILIGIRQGICIIKTDSTVLRVSLVDADFPDYRRVIPAEKGAVVEFDREKVLRSLRRMSVISSERYSGVIITLSQNRMTLESTNPDVGEAKDEIEVVYQDGELKVGYNVRYMIDAIEVIEEDTVVFEVGTGMKPGVIRSAGDGTYMCIIMPLRI